MDSFYNPAGLAHFLITNKKERKVKVINMLRRFSFVLYIAAAFLILSGIAYFVHYLIFRDIHHIFIYMAFHFMKNT